MSRPPVELVRASIEQIQNQRLFSLIEEIYAPIWIDHPVFHRPLGMDGAPVPPGGVRTPREELRASAAFMTARFPEIETRIDEMFEGADETVTVIWTTRAKHRSGREVSYRGVEVFRVEAGRIAEIWTSWDRLGLLQQLGLVPDTEVLMAQEQELGSS